MPKRKALSELDSNARAITGFFKPTQSSANSTVSTPESTALIPAPASVPSTTTAEGSKSKSFNPGGSSDLAWFNILATDPKLAACKKNLTDKVSSQKIDSQRGCITTNISRPVMDKKHLDFALQYFSKTHPRIHFPKRFETYHIAMLAANNLVPVKPPPSLPASLRQVLNKRRKTDDMSKAAVWVCSHRCHDRECINVEHLTWEPSWFNRLRDNCPGGDASTHEPEPCLQPHRDPAEVINWTQVIDEEEEDETVDQ